MGVTRRMLAEGMHEIHVLPRIGQVVFATDDVGDLHFDVIDDIDEVKDVGAVWPTDGLVGLLGGCEMHVSTNEVSDGDGLAAELETNGSIFLGVGATCGFESREVGVIDALTLTLKIGAKITTDFRALIPVDPQPAQSIKDRLTSRFGVARFVGVLNAEDEFAAAIPRIEPVEQGSAGTADVEVTGWGWGKTNANRRCHKELNECRMKKDAQEGILVRMHDS